MDPVSAIKEARVKFDHQTEAAQKRLAAINAELDDLEQRVKRIREQQQLGKLHK